MGIRRLLEQLIGLKRLDLDDAMLDHVPVGTDKHSPGALPEIVNRCRKTEEKIAKARERHGKPFKCAAVDQDREVMIVPGEFRKIGAGRIPTQQMVRPVPTANEIALFGRSRARAGG
jgi:hypothetical protein